MPKFRKKTIDLCYVVLVEKLKRTFQTFLRLHEILHNVSPTIHVTPLVLVKRSVGKKYLYCVYYDKKNLHMWLT